MAVLVLGLVAIVALNRDETPLANANYRDTPSSQDVPAQLPPGGAGAPATQG